MYSGRHCLLKCKAKYLFDIEKDPSIQFRFLKCENAKSRKRLTFTQKRDLFEIEANRFSFSLTFRFRKSLNNSSLSYLSSSSSSSSGFVLIAFPLMANGWWLTMMAMSGHHDDDGRTYRHNVHVGDLH